MRTPIAVAAVAVPPLVLAGIGVSHPHVLTPESATWWRDLHIIGLVAFPLLALGPWVAVQGRGRALRILMVVLGLVYAAFYTALDSIAGIGGGATTLALGPGPWVSALFGIADQVVVPGVQAYLLATLIAAVTVVATAPGARRQATAAVGGVIAVGGAYWFLTSHIYWPEGVATMVALAVGYALLVLAAAPVAARATPAPEEPARVRSTT